MSLRTRFRAFKQGAIWLLALVLFCILAPLAMAQDKWIAPDKFAHLVAGAGTGGAVTFIATQQRWTGDPRLWGTAAGCALGAAKEWNDSRHPDIHTASWKDFAVTCAASGLASYTMGWMLTRQGGVTMVSYSREF